MNEASQIGNDGHTHTVTEAGVGSGPPVVLVHGVGLDHSMWDLVVPILAVSDRGPRLIVRYDMIGHGKSGKADHPPTMGRFVDQLLEVCRQSGQQQAPDVVGLSLGGAIVRAAAVSTPGRFDRVVLANTVFDRSEEQRHGNRQRLDLTMKQGMAPVAELAVARWFTEPWQQENPDRTEMVRQRITTTNLDGYLDAYRVFVDDDPDMADRLSFVANQTLVITGERDSGSTPAMTYEMAALLPNGTAKVLPSTGHLPPIETPDVFTDVLIDFLERPRS